MQSLWMKGIEMSYLELSTAEGTVYVAKEPLHWLWAFDEDQGSFDVQVMFRSGQILDLSFESEKDRHEAVMKLLGFLIGD